MNGDLLHSPVFIKPDSGVVIIGGDEPHANSEPDSVVGV
jgi:hypothetical protein